MIHRIEVATIPVGQPRPRVAKIGGHARAYTPTNHPVHQFRSDVRCEAVKRIAAPLDGPLSVEVLMLFPRPKSMCWKSRPMPRTWHVKRPDADNCAKAVLDALNAIAWHDDSQVASLTVRKCYASGSEPPACVIEIRDMTGTEVSGDD